MKPGAIVEKAREICEDYSGQGLTLTVRQLYYQFVSLGLLPNGQDVYKRIVSAMAEARVAGEFPMHLIEDRGRDAKMSDCLRDDVDVDAALEQCASNVAAFPRQYLERDRWHGQPKYVSVWVEKEALAGVFEQALRGLGVGLFACRGYPSVSALYQYLKNLMAATGGRQVDSQYGETQVGLASEAVVLYFGDHDPDGLQIPISAEETSRRIWENVSELEELRDRDIFPSFERIALNRDQITRYKPPPFPAKETSSRFAAYFRKTGLREAWELDALNPATLRDLIRASVAKHFDTSIERENRRVVKKAREALRERMLDDGWLKSAVEAT